MSEGAADGGCFGTVAEQRRSRVRVEIGDIGSRDASIREREFHHTANSVATFEWRIRVISVGVATVTDEFGNRFGSPQEGMITLLDHKDSGAFSEHEAVAVAVPRARREGRFVIPKRHSAHGTEARHAKWRDGRLRASADHDIGVAVLNDSVGSPNGVRSGGACRSRRQVRSGSSPTNRDLSSRQLDDRRRAKEWGNTSRPLARELPMFALERLETSNTPPQPTTHPARLPPLPSEPRSSPS